MDQNHGLGGPKGLMHVQNLERFRFYARVSRIAKFVALGILVVFLLMFGLWGLVLALPIVIGVGLMLAASGSKYNRYFKDVVVREALGEVFENLRYSPTEGLDREYLWGLDIFAGQSTMSVEDLIEADYRGKHFSQCDLQVKKMKVVTREKRHNTWEIVFSGRVMRFDVAREFPGAVQVVRKDFRDARALSGLKLWKDGITEDEEFNKNFQVLAREPAEGAAVLAPRTIECILRMNERMRGPWTLLFIERRIYVFISSARNAFDVNESFGAAIQEEVALVHRDVGYMVVVLEAVDFGYE